ncbi:hypothetical protein A3I25_00360 [Candidatus Nomurabacteria bacterium RIFCSPLOWO2_02_FULL_42_17]|uniref:Transcriptional regulator n=2 Tax=Candidatus Nomuraibacteriota TaxID=1752729 RepID=A0A1F6WIX3_9BACT|nr:MAG: transcriptional regulator [Parcubacteria group bacterium GW2011_GWA2_42_18]OGI81849.1 MAG: hypothetical protein A3B93_01965 [Candidatus Nomurabacteria bacterium RIFCSPHIGHO2_02_FULL_42_24]OGI96197.1 MAG: hypothetical protein A3I25_00360 [Candidatus Nomurabacteria bacterium RIFCSPLOWO2_02_FULL_42_17]
MSGHNKWSKIKRKKEAGDAKKGQVFSKLVRLITMEAKKCGGDANAPALRAAVEKARAENMPADNIERAIKKGKEPGENLEKITYEAYGPGGVGLIIEVLTDNKNRAVQEIKHLLSENGGNLSGPGSVVWAFKKENDEWVPQSTVPIPEEDGQKLSELIKKLENIDDVQEVHANAE